MIVIEAIREFVELCVLAERIRSKNFDLAEFKAMNDLEEMFAYVQPRLQKLGVGSARSAWVLSSSKALKLARFRDEGKGRAQNEAEFNVSNDPGSSSIIARVLDHDPSFDWIVSQLVRPITEGEFHREFKAEFDDVMFVLLRTASDIKLSPDARASVLDEFDLRSNERAVEFIDAVAQLKEKHDLEVSDITQIEHWGRASDGRIVLLDYGFTFDVMMKHYR